VLTVDDLERLMEDPEGVRVSFHFKTEVLRVMYRLKNGDTSMVEKISNGRGTGVESARAGPVVRVVPPPSVVDPR
jgi:hypothetical protein